MRTKQVKAEDIKKVFGKSSRLWLIVNAYHDIGNVSEYANIYEFEKKDFENDSDLCAIIYGRVNSKGTFKSTKIVTNVLSTKYVNHAIDCISIVDLQEYAHRNNYSNLGVAVEYYLIDKFNGKHGSQRQDKELKQDILIKGHYVQVKCSLATETTKLSYSTTNDSI